MKIFIYRYSIKSVCLNEINMSQWVVIAPNSLRKDYLDTFSKIQLSNCIFMEDFQLSTIFLKILKLSYKSKITKITTLSEQDMQWVGFLDSYFCNNEGSENTFLTNTCFKDKYYMRTILQNIVPQPIFSSVQDIKDVYQFFQKHGKSILKPRNRSAANGIVVINSESDISSLNPKILITEEYLVEKYCYWPHMCTCDGFSINGKIKLFSLHEYETGVLSIFRKNKPFIIRTSRAYKSRTLVTKLFEATQSVINSTITKEVFPFHFEFFYDNDSILFCEGGKRFGGQGVISLPKEEYNVNILSKYWDYQNHYQLDIQNQVLKPTNARVVAWFQILNPGGKLISQPSLPEYDWIIRKFIFVNQNETYDQPEDASDICFSIQFTANDEIEYAKHVKQLTEYADQYKFSSDI